MKKKKPKWIRINIFYEDDTLTGAQINDQYVKVLSYNKSTNMEGKTNLGIVMEYETNNS